MTVLDFLVYDAKGKPPIDMIEAESTAAAAEMARVMWGRTLSVVPAKFRPADAFFLAFRATGAERVER